MCMLSDCVVDGREYLQQEMRSGRPLVFEGGQGALLDPEYGFSPHVTKTTIGFHNAHELLAETGQVNTPRLVAEHCARLSAPH